jgi:glycosyltransferase involved in cell wall biosynthesis
VVTPLVSVILPCHNAAATLEAAVSSVVAQSFRDWELIIFDDGSTDASPEVAERLATEDARIRVVASEHGGIVVALQRACALARGEFLARMDADDYSYPNRLTKQMATMADDKEVALCGTLVRSVGEEVGPGRRRYDAWLNAVVTHEEMVRELFIECPVAHPTFLLRRSSFEAVGGYEDHGWAEDYDLCMRLVQAGGRLAKVQEVLLDWWDSPGRLSMMDDRYSPRQFRALKRHYLRKGPLKDSGRFFQWGAGEVGKQWLREWRPVRPGAVVDINPRKIGTSIHDTPVIAPEELPGPGDAFTVVAVGAPGAREDIRGWFSPRGYTEGEDYLFLA